LARVDACGDGRGPAGQRRTPGRTDVEWNAQRCSDGGQRRSWSRCWTPRQRVRREIRLPALRDAPAASRGITAYGSVRLRPVAVAGPGLNITGRRLTGLLIDNWDDLDRPPVGGDVELEVHRLHPIGCIRDDGRWCGGATVAIVPAALWHSKPLFAPKALHFLVIDCPAFCTGVVIRGPKWRSQNRNVTSGSWRVAVTGAWRLVARCCPVTRQANCSLTPTTRCS
jgi:hypothetical protein